MTTNEVMLVIQLCAVVFGVPAAITGVKLGFKIYEQHLLDKAIANGEFPSFKQADAAAK